MGEGDVAVVKILRGGADGSQRGRANTVVRRLDLCCKGLRRRDWQIHGRELQRTEAGSGERCGLWRRYWLCGRGCRRRGSQIVPLSRG